MKQDIVNIATFVITAAVLLVVMNDDVLYMACDRSLFLEGSLFAQDCLRHIGGGLEWAGCALTSLFALPWLGATVLILLWVTGYWLLRRVCPFTATWRWLLLVPFVALLISIIDLGYWVYYLRQPGYFFRETLGILFVILIANMRRYYLALFLAVMLYPLVGFYAVVVLLMLLLKSALGRRWSKAGVAALLLLLAPPLIAKQYTTLPWREAWSAGYPLISYQSSCPLALNLPIVIALLSVIALPVLCPKRNEQESLPSTERGWRDWRLALSLPICAIPFLLNFHSPHFHAELRSYRAIDEFRFDEVLRQFTSVPEGPTRQMIMQKNLALLYTGHLGDMMFRYPNMGPEPEFSYHLNAHTAQMEAPQFYLFHGLANDATRWCFESGVEMGFNRGQLKTMTLAAILNEEWPLAVKYLDMLRLDPASSDFVARYYPLAITPSSLGQYTELQLMKMLHDDLVERIAGDQGDVEARIYRAFSNQLTFSNNYTQEVALTYAMMRKDYKLIWLHLEEYRRLHPNRPMPLHFQEAAYVGLEVDPMGHKPEEFMLDADVAARYKRFKSQQHPTFDQSYWWFLFFCKNVKVY